MIYRTICSMDNITISMDGDCHDLCCMLCEVQNAFLERSREDIAKAQLDMMLYGSCMTYTTPDQLHHVPLNQLVA